MTAERGSDLRCSDLFSRAFDPTLKSLPNPDNTGGFGIFPTPGRRVRARGLQEWRLALVGRVPSRGTRLPFPSNWEIYGPGSLNKSS